MGLSYETLVWEEREEDYDFEKLYPEEAAAAAALGLDSVVKKEQEGEIDPEIAEQYDSEDDYHSGEHKEEFNRKQKRIRGSPSLNPLRGWRRG